MGNVSINISTQFSDAPGGRYKAEGPKSGEEFREMFLLPAFTDETNTRITVILDGTYGYATSFLEEAFGGLARELGTNIVNAKLHLVSDEDPYLIDRIHNYINKANQKG